MGYVIWLSHWLTLPRGQINRKTVLSIEHSRTSTPLIRDLRESTVASAFILHTLTECLCQASGAIVAAYSTCECRRWQERPPSCEGESEGDGQRHPSPQARPHR